MTEHEKDLTLPILDVFIKEGPMVEFLKGTKQLDNPAACRTYCRRSSLTCDGLSSLMCQSSP
ncbi:hypothetical protein QCA50_019507 [Cerrena zonata]|uniref:Uncharacterized protein n=1 Tax=Cerrena zonata TaxID=2478898 RepID=A0AAW0FAQ3_9APHY